MVVDFGMGLNQIEDILTVSGEYVDIAKIAVGTSALMPPEVLKKKIQLYAKHKVSTSPGGQFLEYAFYQGTEKAFFDNCKKAGFPSIEVSANDVDIDHKGKARLIKTATNDYGFKVLGETGAKYEKSTPENMVADIQNMLNAGAWKIFVEAAEFFDAGKLNRKVIDHLAKKVRMSALIFELPGAWIKGITDDMVHDFMLFMVVELGHEVNIANLAPDRVLFLEAQRRGIGTKHRQPEDIVGPQLKRRRKPAG
jgi:phosphosulfolactate synthase